jgi:hypothetical protein
MQTDIQQKKTIKRLTIELEQKEHAKIKTFASIHGISIRDFVMEALHDKFDRESLSEETKDIIKGLEEVKKIRSGKLKKQSINEFLNEL